MNGFGEPSALRREQEFYLLGLVHDGVQDAVDLLERWCALYPAHRGGGRARFEEIIRQLAGDGKVEVVFDGARAVRLSPRAGQSNST